MRDSELHAQAGVWQYHDTGMAVLFMEGEARDRSPSLFRAGGC